MFVNAVRLGRSLHGDVDRRTADILTRSHRLQMGRVDAFPDATEMVQLHPLRDGADERLVGDSVCHLRATRNIDETVAFLAHPLALPDPTPVSVDLDAGFDPSGNGSCRSSSRHWYPRFVRWGLVLSWVATRPR